MLPPQLKKELVSKQRNELTEHLIYKKLAESNQKNKRVLDEIAAEELEHYNLWKKYTNEEVAPNQLMLSKYVLISRIFGLTFGLKLMENGEKKAQISYHALSKQIPDAKNIEKEENAHEKKLLSLIDEERLKYVSSVVLGLNDALVELTGTLAGLTLALQKTSLVATAGLITGIAASLSMAASEYQSTKAEEGEKEPLRASIYTGIAYTLTVLFLVAPFFIFGNVYIALASTILNVIIVLLVFTFYISVAKELNFRKRFLEMATISLGVAAVSFLIGFLVRTYLGIEI